MPIYASYVDNNTFINMIFNYPNTSFILIVHRCLEVPTGIYRPTVLENK